MINGEALLQGSSARAVEANLDLTSTVATV